MERWGGRLFPSGAIATVAGVYACDSEGDPGGMLTEEDDVEIYALAKRGWSISWRIRLTDDVCRRFVPDVPEGFVPLAEAARQLGCARQTVLHKVQRGELKSVQVTKGRRKGLRIEVPGAALDRLVNE